MVNLLSQAIKQEREKEPRTNSPTPVRASKVREPEKERSLIDTGLRSTRLEATILAFLPKIGHLPDMYRVSSLTRPSMT